MRTLTLLVGALSAIAGLLAPPRDAAAGVSYDFVFRSTDDTGAVISGGRAFGATFLWDDTAAAAACNPTTLAGCAVSDILVRTSTPLFAFSFSIGFDDLVGGVSIARAAEWRGIGVVFDGAGNAVVTMAPLGGLGPGPNLGFKRTVSSFDGAVPVPNGPPSLAPGTYNVGTIVWDSSGQLAAVPIMALVITNPNLDATGGVVNGTRVNLTGTEFLGMGAIGFIPEPATAGLVGLGLAALGLLGRRGRR